MSFDKHSARLHNPGKIHIIEESRHIPFELVVVDHLTSCGSQKLCRHRDRTSPRPLLPHLTRGYLPLFLSSPPHHQPSAISWYLAPIDMILKTL